MTVQVPVQLLEDLVEDLQSRTVGIEDELDLRLTYSGRGMYGRRCVGIVTANPNQLLFELGLLMAEYQTDVVDDFAAWDDLIEAFSRPSMDAMGLSTIIYWPQIEALHE